MLHATCAAYSAELVLMTLGFAMSSQCRQCVDLCCPFGSDTRATSGSGRERRERAVRATWEIYNVWFLLEFVCTPTRIGKCSWAALSWVQNYWRRVAVRVCCRRLVFLPSFSCVGSHDRSMNGLASLLVGLLVWSAWLTADGWLMYKNVRMQAQQHQFFNNFHSENTRSEQNEINRIIFFKGTCT